MRAVSLRFVLALLKLCFVIEQATCFYNGPRAIAKSVPGDCKKFQLCDSTRCTVFDCAPGTAWNSAVNTCDYPQNARSECNSITFNENHHIVNTLAPIQYPDESVHIAAHVPVQLTFQPHDEAAAAAAAAATDDRKDAKASTANDEEIPFNTNAQSVSHAQTEVKSGLQVEAEAKTHHRVDTPPVQNNVVAHDSADGDSQKKPEIFEFQHSFYTPDTEYVLYKVLLGCDSQPFQLVNGRQFLHTYCLALRQKRTLTTWRKNIFTDLID